jgi:hypothetical protein
MFLLLPFVEEDVLYKASLDPATGVHNAANNSINLKPVKLFLCPSDPSAPTNGKHVDGFGATSYACNVQALGTAEPLSPWTVTTWQGSARIPTSFQDGTSKTIVVAERYARCGPSASIALMRWGATLSGDVSAPGFAWHPNGIGANAKFQAQPSPFNSANCDPARANAPHTAGMQVCLADGSVRVVGANVSSATWWAACTPAANDIVDSDW